MEYLNLNLPRFMISQGVLGRLGGSDEPYKLEDIKSQPRKNGKTGKYGILISLTTYPTGNSMGKT